MAISSVFTGIVAIFTNLYIIIPFYMALMGQDMSYFVAMCTEVNPLIFQCIHTGNPWDSALQPD